MENNRKDNQIVIYEGKDGANIEINLIEDSIWLTQYQISSLFDTDRSTITKHISNILSLNELNEESNVQKMHIANSDKKVKFYTLDMVLSVGYRVNSSKATQFRIWATSTLKKYLLDGYIVNEKKLKEENQKLKEFQETVKFITSKIDKEELIGKEKKF